MSRSKRLDGTLWHFTNFTIAHSHLTMYGFVVFLIWGGIYGLLSHLIFAYNVWCMRSGKQPVDETAPAPAAA